MEIKKSDFLLRGALKEAPLFVYFITDKKRLERIFFCDKITQLIKGGNEKVF